MSFSSLESVSHPGIGEMASSVLAKGASCSAEGAVIGVALGVIGTVHYIRNYKGEFSEFMIPPILVHCFTGITLIGAGAVCGGVIGAVYGVAKGTLHQIV